MVSFHPNPGTLFRELFPEQTRSPFRVFLCALLYLADLVLVFLVGNALGFDPLTALNELVLMLYLGIAFALFCLEVFLYNRINGLS